MKTNLLIAIFSISFFNLSMAQNDSTAIELKEIIIRENRLEIPFSKVSRNINVIGKKEIETSPSRSLQEVLSFTPGVDVRQRGVSGVQANIGIRGGSFEQTLMLLNGIKLTDPQTGHHLMNIPVPLTSIQRIEVLKGSGSRIYGQNAFAGAVNVVTELPSTQSLNIQGFLGDFGMRGGSLMTSLPVGNYKQTISVSHDASDGHWYNSDFNVNNVFYEGGLNLKANHELNILLGYSDRKFGANGFYTNRFPDQWESTQTLLTALTHTFQKNNFYLQSRTYWRNNKDEFRLKRKEPAFFTNNHESNVSALELNGRYSSRWGVTGVGIEGRKEILNSTNLGLRERTLGGVFLEHRIEFLQGFDLRAGMYSNYFDQYRWKHFPGIELGYQINKASRIYSNYGTSFRIPSFTELYYEDPSNLSNPNLLPEEAQSFEIGWKYEQKKVGSELVFFSRSSQNLIDWNRNPSAISPNPNRWMPRNISSVNFLGFETSLSYQPEFKSGEFILKNISISYSYIDASLDQAPNVESRYALNALKNQIVGGFQLEFFKKTELNIKTRYLERMAMDPYFLLDAKLNYNRMKSLGFFGEVTNITNTEYLEAGFVQMPGRWFKVGILVNL